MYTHLKNRFSLTVTILALCAGSASAVTNYVDRAFTGKEPLGDSWASPFPSLQAAIDACAESGGGEVWVKAGVYKPTDSSRNATFELKPNISVYGGFRGGETDRSQRIPRSNRTVLSGDIGKPGSTSDNCFHILTGASGCVVDGFIISRGNANSAAENRMGGALILPAGTKDMELANCTLEKNNAEIGGAIQLTDASLSITNCTFYSNAAEDGAAIAVDGASVLILKGSTFSSNFAPKSGGSLLINPGASVQISDTSFMYNSTDGTGGALLATASKEMGINLEISSCTFTENSSKSGGGALAFRGPFTPLITDSVFERNFSRKGAGAIANSKGTTAVVINPTYTENRGAAGSPDFSTDSTSKMTADRSAVVASKMPVFSDTGAADRTSDTEAEKKPARNLPDVHVYNESNLKVKLTSLVAANPFTILALGDLTDPNFIEHFQNIECNAKDYTGQGVGFFYIYRSLQHPENNGYIRAFNQQERARQAKVAEEKLQTSVPWLYDQMDNESAVALDPDLVNGLFIFDAEGKELFAGPMKEAEKLREKLVELVGITETLTTADLLPTPLIEPESSTQSTLVKRIRINPRVDKFTALELIPQDSKTPFYVKLRAEGDESLMSSGDGKLYIGFHIDPLYGVAWNNMADPMKYTLKSPAGVIAPSINSAPRVTGQATDAEPREFMLQARKLDIKQPLSLTVEYSIHSIKSKRNLAVKQNYLIYLQEDQFGGIVFGRQEGKKTEKETVRDASGAFAMMLRRYDLDRNKKLSNDEVIGTLRTNFNEIDKNDDGYISEPEYAEYRDQM